jgi:hypothetical protein
MVDKAKTGEVSTYRYIGNRAEIMESGAPLAPGDFIELENLNGVDKTLFDDGDLIEVTTPTTAKTESEK